MTTDLIRPLELDFEKEAEDKASIDPNRWQTDVLKKIAEDYPYLLVGTEVNVVFKAKDEQLGMGFGGVYITNREAQTKRYQGQYDTMQQESYGQSEPVASEEGATRTIIIPVLINDWKMSPMDVFVYDRAVFPITETRVAEALFSNRIFSHHDVEREGDTGYGSDASIADKMYPPAEAVYGYGTYGHGGGGGGGGMVTYGSAPLSDLVASSVRPEHRGEFLAFCKSGEAEMGSMLMGLEPFMEKMLRASRAYEDSSAVSELEGHVAPANVVRIKPAVGRDGIIQVTTTHDTHYDPQYAELTMEETLGRFGVMVPDLRSRLLAGDTVILTLDHEITEPIVLEDYEVEANPVVGEGKHVLMDRQGDFRSYSVFQQVCELNGDLCEGVKLFTDGTRWGLQDSLVGEATGEANEIREGDIEPGATGVFVFQRDGSTCVTLPLKICSYAADQCKQRLSMTVVDALGREHLVIITPGIRQIVSKSGVMNAELGQHLAMNTWYVPADYPFVRVGQKTSAAEHVDQLQRVFHQQVGTMVSKHHDNQRRFRIDGANTKEECYRWEDGNLPTGSSDAELNPGSHHENCLVGISKARGMGHWILHGRTIESTEHAVAQIELPEKEALFLLATLGLSLEQGKALLMRAMESDIHVANLWQPLRLQTKTKMASATNELLEQIAEDLRSPMWKEGAALTMPLRSPRVAGAFVSMRDFLHLEKRAQDEMTPDEQTIDTVLSLGFINPENLAAFLQKLPAMKQSEGFLGELLLLLRLGLQGIKEEPVKGALKSLNRVNEALESLASYGTHPA